MNKKNNNAFTSFSAFGSPSKSILKKDARNPFTAEEQAIWDRFAETSLCTLMQNSSKSTDAGAKANNLAMVEEAGQMADTLLNMRRERFEDESSDEMGTRFEDTGVFTIPHSMRKKAQG